MKPLPRFRAIRREDVLAYITEVLTPTHNADLPQLHKLIPYADGHFRALFHRAFFVLQPGESEPTKSQWNNLKKKMKRHDENVFIFKEHGEADCETGEPLDPTQRGQGCYYVDFGFFARRDRF